jgi:hypothetical protein
MSQAMGPWDRDFQVWHYSVSHSTLLLRSIDADRYDTRVDVAFFGVRAMYVRDSYDMLAVTTGPPADQMTLSDQKWAGEPLVHFTINGGPDYVLATNCSCHEDNGDSRSASKFGPLRATASRSQLFSWGQCRW